MAKASVVNRDWMLGKLKAGLHRIYGERLERTVLFGSHARGDASEHSDVDVLVVLRGDFVRREERKKVLPLITELSLDTGELPSIRIVSESRYLNAQDSLILNVKREGIVL
jgi:predicted nucleotidyltransferase